MRCRDCGNGFPIWRAMCPHCGMLRPNYVKRAILWVGTAVGLVVAVYVLSHLAIRFGSGAD